MRRLVWLLVILPSVAFAGDPQCPIHHVEGQWTGRTKIDQWEGLVYEYSHVVKGPHAYWSTQAPGASSTAGPKQAPASEPLRPAPSPPKHEPFQYSHDSSDLMRQLGEARRQREASDREERRLRMREEDHQLRIEESRARMRLLDEQRELVEQQSAANLQAGEGQAVSMPFESVQKMLVALWVGLNGPTRYEETTEFALAVGYIAGVHQTLSLSHPCLHAPVNLTHGQLAQKWIDQAKKAPGEWRNPGAVAAITASALLEAYNCPAGLAHEN